ncbi:MAG: DUF2939 domain-containing protein [bacterium]
MSTYIFKNDQQLGPFDDAAILSALKEKTYSYDDWAWREGWEEWKALRSIFPEPPGEITIEVEKLPKMRISPIVYAVIGAILLIAVYVASPYCTLWRLKSALSSNDRSGIESLIDFPSVRESLKDQIGNQLSVQLGEDKERQNNPLTLMAQAFAPALINGLVDNFVTPSGIVSFIGKSHGTVKLSDPSFSGVMDSSIDWSRTSRGFFTGPTEFAAEVNGIKLHLRFMGTGWKVASMGIKLGN